MLLLLIVGSGAIVIVVDSLPFATMIATTTSSQSDFSSPWAVCWELHVFCFLVMLLSIARRENWFSFNDLIHTIDSVVVFLKPADLASQESNFSLHVVHSNFEVIVVIEKFGILFLVASQMSLLVLNVSSQSGTFPVPEVDLISILTGTLLKEVLLPFL